MSDTFTTCQSIHKLIESGDDDQARDQLIQLLDTLDKESQPRNELVNHLTRSLGLYQYIDPETAIWQDRLAHEAFQADIGGGETKTMHRDQSHLLKMLLEGKDIAVSAPTSFGKSFVIDAFISIREPQNVVIIVPTIALMDETRRRLTKKFSSLYKIVTTSDCNLEDRNILIFPQERALSYLKNLDSVDLLIVDEFYKASNEFKSSTDGRSSLLLNVILEFSKIAKQRYFLAPNISSLKENIFTKGMKFHEFKMSTVYLKTNEEYRSIKGSAGEKQKQKTAILLDLLTGDESKTNTLIYAGTYSEVEKVSNIIIKDVNCYTSPLLIQFSKWIKKNYSPNWNLSELVKRGTGIHNGRIPRSLAQIQIKLFEKSENGLENIISTSSIIEGVNTSAERVVLWKNKNGTPRIKSFDYKNLIGRGGRMFQYFVGHIHVLEEPPASVETQLTLDVPDEILVTMDDTEQAENQLTNEQIGKIIAFKEELKELLNSGQMKRLLSGGLLQSVDLKVAKKILQAIHSNPTYWNNLKNLNSANTRHWDNVLYEIIKLSPLHGTRHRDIVEVIKLLTQMWDKGLAPILIHLEKKEISALQFFQIEKYICFNLSTMIHDLNMVNMEIFKSRADGSSFAVRAAHCFLPVHVYQLEEYGLPRMVSRKIHMSGKIDLVSTELSIHEVLEKFIGVGVEQLHNIPDIDEFDKFVISHFMDGIE